MFLQQLCLAGVVAPRLLRDVIVATSGNLQKSTGPGSRPTYISKNHIGRYIRFFNEIDLATEESGIPNSEVMDWLVESVPLFECSDPLIEEIYYFRWWTYRKHIRKTPAGYVITEFIVPVKHAGIYNTISCAVGHHIYEGRWLRNQVYIKDYIRFWLTGHNGTLQPHLHQYSNWIADAVFAQYRVHNDKAFTLSLLDHLITDYKLWEQERRMPNSLFWQYDVRDGMEESICGSRTRKNIRPTINSYMFANAKAISSISAMAGRHDLSAQFWSKATQLKKLVQECLWDNQAQFFKVILDDGSFCDAREAIGFIPWQFCLPEDDFKYAVAWEQILDPDGFLAPWGFTTAERRHPRFRSHGVGSCEWDGAIWPFATSQTLTAMANLLHFYEKHSMKANIFYNALQTYARSHQKSGLPYIGEYQDELTGRWLRDQPRSRYYNHSTFCDLVIYGLVGLIPHPDEKIEIHPLFPPEAVEFLCLEKVPYHGHTVTILWDKHGVRYNLGKGLHLVVDGQLLQTGPTVTRLTARID